MNSVNLSEWQTIAAAVARYGLPVSEIEAAIDRRDLRVAIVCGERLLNRYELQALSLSKRAEYGGCEGCEE